MLIAVEGIDGVGKTTLCAELAKVIPDSSTSYGGCSLAELPPNFRRAFDLAKSGLVPPPDIFSRLPFAVARVANAGYLGCAANDLYTIICDRYSGANAAYAYAQVLKTEMSNGAAIQAADWLLELEFQRLDIPRPTVTFILVAPPAAIRDRLEAARQEQYAAQAEIDREEVDLSRLSALDGFYRYYLPTLLRAYGMKSVLVDAFDGIVPKSTETLTNEILHAIKELP